MFSGVIQSDELGFVCNLVW